MKERPILFSAPMIRALLAGAKTQTRRAARAPRGYELDGAGFGRLLCSRPNNSTGERVVACPYGVPGDRLWVRESYAPAYFGYCRAGYRADWTRAAADSCAEPKWTPSIYMPRAASRITLEVTEVRVQRVQSISELDAIAEGCTPTRDSSSQYYYGAEHPIKGGRKVFPTAVCAYESLWDAINGKRPGCSWGDNPWVWCVTFERVP